MFTEGFDKYACDGDSITCTVDGYDCTAIIHHDDSSGAPDEMGDGFWPSLDESDAGWIGPNKTESDLVVEMERAQSVMDAWENNEWWYVGVAVTVSKNGIQLTGAYDHAVWGTECNHPDGDNSHLTELANEELDAAIDAARAAIATYRLTAFTPRRKHSTNWKTGDTMRYGYIYQADVYCDECGDAICESLTAQGKAPLDAMDQVSYDSDDYPKSADIGNEESDTPMHCAQCGEFFCNPLTSEGYAYVQDSLNEASMGQVAVTKVSQLSDVLQAWASWYGFRYYDAEDIADSLKTDRTPGWYSDEAY